MQRTGFSQLVFNLAVLLALVGLLVGIGWLLALAIREGATLLGASLVAVATVGAALIVRYFERRKELEAARREHLGSLYEELAAVMAGQELSQRRTEKVVTQFIRKSLIYASPATINAFKDWRDNVPQVEDPPRQDGRANALRYEAFVKSMRTDVGSSNRGLGEGDLTRAVITDFDEYFGGLSA